MGMIDAADVALALVAAGGAELPQTGRAIPLLAAGVAIGVALLLRIGGSRLGTGDDPGAEPDGSSPAEVDADRPLDG